MLNIFLRPNLEEYVTLQVKLGEFPDASSVISNALKIMMETQEDQESKTGDIK
jgi:Arc/MetJ-type ribon-helix-helix transcriptional regulator